MKRLRFTFPVIVLIATAIAVMSMQRQPLQADAQTTRSWDHKVVVVQASHPDEMEAKLAKLGAEGWECVGLSFPGENVRVGYLVLKRQK